MAEEQEFLTMSQVDIKRLQFLGKLIGRQLKQVEAAQALRLSVRQVRRLIKRFKQEGAKGLIHRLRGRPGKRAFGPKIRKRVLEACAERYLGFGPTLASEKLAECEKIKISKETLRQWLIQEGAWQPAASGKKRHLKWRERKSCYGQMLQMDGSHHDWLEGRGPWLVLMAQIDDATSRVSARFYEYEGVIPAMDSVKRHIQRHGIPLSIYLDRHKTYKATGEPTLEEQLAGQKVLSQFQRSCAKLGIDVIHAQSPEAKGRVERLFKTLQDRLVKEMRLEGVKTLEEANKFLERFLVRFNARFSVPAGSGADLHRTIPKGTDLNGIFSIENTRSLRSDNTVVHERKWYQVLTPVKAKQIVVQERLDGQTRLLANGRSVRYKNIAGPVVRPVLPASKVKYVAKPVPPRSTHPWKRPAIAGRRQEQKRTFSTCQKEDILILP